MCLGTLLHANGTTPTSESKRFTAFLPVQVYEGESFIILCLPVCLPGTY